MKNILGEKVLILKIQNNIHLGVMLCKYFNSAVAIWLNFADKCCFYFVCEIYYLYVYFYYMECYYAYWLF